MIIDLDVPEDIEVRIETFTGLAVETPPSFAPDGDEVEHLMYGYSIFICPPDGRSSCTSAATGTVMRPSRLHDYARAVGFSEFEVLPITDFSFFCFYRLS